MQLSSAVVTLSGVWMRGGTSKCWFLAEEDLPERGAERDRLLVAAFGSQAKRQVDGVGGGTSTTSKVVVVSRHAAEAGLVMYEFGQVAVAEPIVEWTSNCGNCAAGLGLYALEMGWGSCAEERELVRLVNQRTGLEVRVSTATSPNTEATALVPGETGNVCIEFESSSWTTPGCALFPTGNATDSVAVGGVVTRATLIDAGTPAVFIDARSLGLEDGAVLTGARLQGLVNELRAARRAASGSFGVGAGIGEAIPKIGVVGQGSGDGRSDIEVQMLSMSELHPAIGLTSAVALAAASATPGTTVADAIGGLSDHVPRHELRIGTQSGAVVARLGHSAVGSLATVGFARTARRIADARIQVPVRSRGSVPASL